MTMLHARRFHVDNTELLFSKNISQKDQDCIIIIWGVQHMRYHNKYLDIPSREERSKQQTFRAFNERYGGSYRVERRSCFFRQVEEVLIKVVA